LIWDFFYSFTWVFWTLYFHVSPNLGFHMFCFCFYSPQSTFWFSWWFLPDCLLRTVLFNFHIVGISPIPFWFWCLILFHCVWWTCIRRNSFPYLWSLTLWHMIWPTLETVLTPFRRMWILPFCWNVIEMSVMNSWIEVFKSSLSFLIFCYLFYPLLKVELWGFYFHWIIYFSL
jgi:hypothetical protein